MVEKRLRVIDTSSTYEFKTHIFEFREFLVTMDEHFTKKDSGLLSIRDDLLVDINQFLYLMSLNR